MNHERNTSRSTASRHAGNHAEIPVRATVCSTESRYVKWCVARSPCWYLLTSNFVLAKGPSLALSLPPPPHRRYMQTTPALTPRRMTLRSYTRGLSTRSVTRRTNTEDQRERWL